jgi:hypothetical protein
MLKPGVRIKSAHRVVMQRDTRSLVVACSAAPTIPCLLEKKMLLRVLRVGKHSSLGKHYALLRILWVEGRREIAKAPSFFLRHANSDWMRGP